MLATSLIDPHGNKNVLNFCQRDNYPQTFYWYEKVCFYTSTRAKQLSQSQTIPGLGKPSLKIQKSFFSKTNKNHENDVH